MSSTAKMKPRGIQFAVLILALLMGLWANRGLTQGPEPLQPPPAIVFQPGDPAARGLVVPRLIPGVVLVRLGEPVARLGDAAQRLGVVPESLSPLAISGQPNLYRLAVHAGQEEAEAHRLARLAHVLYAEPDYTVFIAQTTPPEITPAETTPNDSLYNTYQWNLRHIRANVGWDRTTGSSSVVIAIVDTGVDLDHPDLAEKMVGGIDTVNNDTVAQDDHGHGTHVASIAAGVSNNGRGIAGVDWQARIMPVKVLNEDGAGSKSQLASGITWAVDNGAQVLNMSLAGSSPSLVVRNAIDYAHSRGALLIAAAGNHYKEGNPTSYPAAYEHVLGVASVNDSDGHASYSSSGAYVDVAAPGGDPTGSGDNNLRHWIPGAYLRDAGASYALLSGTSQAAPHVAGLAGLILSLNPALTPDQLTGLITSTAVDVQSPGWDPFSGHGRIDVAAALEAVQPPATATPTFTPTPSPTPTSTPTPSATPTPAPPARSRDDVRVNSSSVNVQSRPVLGIDSKGNLTVLWLDWRSSAAALYSAGMGASGINWGANLPVTGSQQISPTDEIGLPGLAVSPNGDVLVAWHDDELGNSETDIYLSRQIGGLWGAPAQINDDSLPPAAQTSPALVTASDGARVAVWEDGREAARSGAATQLYWSQWESSSGSWQAAQAIGPSSLAQKSPHLALGSGAVYAVWVETSAATSRLLFSRRNLNDTDWDPPTVLSTGTAADSIGAPVVVTDGGMNGGMNGGVNSGEQRVVVAWEEKRDENVRIFTSGWSATDGWGAPQPVSAAEGAGGQFTPRLAANQKEIALVWQESGGDPGDIYSAWASWATGVWSPPRRVNQDKGAVLQSEPDVAVDTWGHTTVVWSDGRGGASAPDIYARFLPAGERYQLYLPEIERR